MAKEKKRIEFTGFRELDADKLKASVQEMLVLMEALERKLFIKTLEYEMFRAGLSIRDYLIPLGITATCAEDLSPNEVGHLVRFFRINVPKAMSAVARVFDDCPVFETGREMMNAWLPKAVRQEAWD